MAKIGGKLNKRWKWVKNKWKIKGNEKFVKKKSKCKINKKEK